ncbi:MAG: hypothetical protein H6835_02355 [Planctomycetes bacterium]|nr:hypothetical protein [Planctomycetota bacterium]
MRTTLFVVTLTCLSAALPAQDRRGGRGDRGPRGMRMPPLPAVQVLDADQDGEISAAERKAAASALLTLDKNGDGNLTSDELMPDFGGRRGADGPPGGGPGGFPGGPGGPPGMGGPGGPMGMMGAHPVMAALDLDGDGELFDDEVTDAARSLLKADRDGDGVVSAEEMRPTRGGFPGGPGGPPGMGGPGGFGGRGGERPDHVLQPDELEFDDGAATIGDREAFHALSYQGEEVMIDTHLANLEFVKFQIEAADSDAPRLYFMNTKTYRAHPMFMQRIGVDERDGTMRMRGVLVYRPLLVSPSGKPGLYTFEFEPNDAYPFADIQMAYRLLQAKAKPLAGNLSYNLLPRAEQRWQREEELYEQAKLPVFHADDVYGETAFAPLHRAVSFGRLRLMHGDERPAVHDVVVYTELPNEMPRTAGVLTGARQTPLSHVNLRCVQDDVPNAYVRGVADDERVRTLLGKLVRYEVRGDGYELRAATQQEVDAHFAALRPKQVQKPPRDLAVRAIRPFAELGFDDHRSVGVKAANLAVLRTFGWPDERSPDGFAVPFACYDAFMKENGFYAMAKEMMAAKDFRVDADTRERALAEFRKAIENGRMPKWVEDALGEVQAKFGKDESIRCRSSTNNEDLPGFSGAGLYDSFTHKPKESHLAKTIRQVYASLWNFRAFEEREFYRVDHFAAAMGVALHANEKKERANGVAVTKDVSGRLVAGASKVVQYYVNAQVGEDLVTNPEARSVPEELLIGPRNPRGDRVLQRSNRAGDQPLLDPDTLLELRRCLRTVHERFATLYGRQDDPEFAMEVEFKVDKKGRLLVKQARPWVE